MNDSELRDRFSINANNGYPIMILADTSLSVNFLHFVNCYMEEQSDEAIYNFKNFMSSNKIQIYEVVKHLEDIKQLYMKDHSLERFSKDHPGDIVDHIHENHDDQDIYWWTENALHNEQSLEVCTAILETILKSYHLKNPIMKTSFVHFKIFDHSTLLRMAPKSCEPHKGRIFHQDKIGKFPHSLGCTCLAHPHFIGGKKS